jgi:lipoprotein-releasing system permease protein
MLALRYLRPKRTAVSIITLISVVGVMLGVAVLIIVISVMSGFDRELRAKILGFNAHLKVFRTGESLENYQKVMSVVSTNAYVKGVAPFVMGPVLVATDPPDGKRQAVALMLRGIDPRCEGKVSILPSSIVRGSFNLSEKGVLIGREVARHLNLDIGDRLDIASVSSLQKMMESQKKHEEEFFRPDEYIISGIFDVGYYEFDSSVIVCSLGNAQDLNELGDAVHGLMVMLHDPYKAGTVRTQLRAALGPDFSVRTWSEENSGILTALIVEKNMMFYILFFIMIVAAFGITSALITFVVQKTREIGMLKALGASGRQIMWLFLSQSVMVGVLGVLSGFGLGMLAVSYRNEFLHLMNRLTGSDLFPPSIYYFDELPALIIPSDILLICGGSLFICLLAGLLPAWNAGRLKPVEALRHE